MRTRKWDESIRRAESLVSLSRGAEKNAPEERDAEPETKPSPNRDEQRGFKTFGEQLMAVYRSAVPGGRVDERLTTRAASGLNETNPSDGGFLVQKDFVAELLKKTYETGILAPKARKILISTNSNGLKINAVDDDSRKARAIDRGVIVRSGFMQAYGYFGCGDTDTQFNFVMPSTTQYIHLYAEIDLSVVPNRFAIKATVMSNNASWSPRQDNLRTVSNGKYQFPLWQVTLNASSVYLSDKRTFFSKPLNAVNAETASNTLAVGGANVTRSGGVFSMSSGGSVLGKLVCIPQGAKMEYKIPILSKPYSFYYGHLEITIPNYDLHKVYEWHYMLNWDYPGSVVRRVKGKEFTLAMNGMTLFVHSTGGGTFYDGGLRDWDGSWGDFRDEQCEISQIYEICEVG